MLSPDLHGTLFLENMKMKKMLKTVVLKTLPVMAGYLALGIGFGILAKSNGIGILGVFAMSLFIYAGSMQFLTVGLLTGGASLLTVALTTLTVNARHLFYGISMIETYKNIGPAKPYLIFGLTDETYALVCSGEYPEEIDKRKYCFWVTLFNHAYWITGSVLGALIGSLLRFDTTGIDFAMTALFITIFVDQWKSTRNHIPAITGVAAAAVCLVVFGADSFLIPTMLLIGAVLLFGKKRVSEGEVLQHGE